MGKFYLHYLFFNSNNFYLKNDHKKYPKTISFALQYACQELRRLLVLVSVVTSARRRWMLVSVGWSC